MFNFYTHEKVAKFQREELLRKAEHAQLIAQLSAVRAVSNGRSTHPLDVVRAVRRMLHMLRFRPSAAASEGQ